MINYDLKADEAFVFECEDISLDDGNRRNEKGNLVITSQNLIWAAKNMFGKAKSIYKYPLCDIKVYDGQAQVKLKEKLGELTRLDVFLKNDQLAFRIGEKKKARELANHINRLVTGSNRDLVAKSAVPGAAFVAETLKGTAGTIRNAIGVKPKQVTQTCAACGAQVSGVKGQTG